MKRALREMPYCPSLLLADLDLLLSFPRDTEHLQRQAAVLEQIYRELPEKVAD